MPRALLVANPMASKVEVDAFAVIRSVCAEAGWTLEVAATLGPGDARRQAARAVTERFDRVLCYGGDGTAMQVAAALVGSGIPLGLVPGGTGNVLAGNLRLPQAPLHAAYAAVRGRPKRMDLGRVERSDGEHYFAVTAGAGYDARLMVETVTEAKQRWGFAAYLAGLIRLLPRIRNTGYTVVTDGRVMDLDAALVMVFNCPEIIPPWFRLDRGIAPDDGVFDVVIVRAKGVWQSAGALWHLWRRECGKGGAVQWLRGREVEIRAAEPQPAQLDGEPMGLTPLRAVNVPGALEVIVDPAN